MFSGDGRRHGRKDSGMRSTLGCWTVIFGLTALVAAWAQRIRDRFASQDDLIEIDGEIVLPDQVEADVD